MTLVNEGFESGTGACDGWKDTDIADDYGLDPYPHSGTKSCYVCNDASSSALLYKTISITQSGTLTASTWFLAYDETTATEVDLNVVGASGGAQGTGSATTKAYSQVATSTGLAVTAGQQVKVSVGITRTPTPGDCLEVDDILVTLTPSN